MGRACALVEQSEESTVSMKGACRDLGSSDFMRPSKAQLIIAIVYEALAKVELNAPARVQGTFIRAGHMMRPHWVVQV
jgi:hypothetical protein